LGDVQGTVADGFEPVRDAFAANFAERGDVGAALTVHRDGRPVVDLWGGRRDADAESGSQPDSDGEGGGPAPWRSGTAVVLRSATKGPAAAVLHLLHQRGQLDLDAPVGTYWPEFKAAGKERVLVRQLLTHRAGVPALDTPLSPAAAVDGVSGPRAVAAQSPWWEPGTAHGYHAQTFSWLLGELVLRATGRGLGRWFAEEVARPYGLDLWLGTPTAAGRTAVGAGSTGTAGSAGAAVPAGTAGAAGLPVPASRLARLAEVATPPPPPAEPGGLRVRPKRSVTAAYRDPDSLTRRAFGAIDPAPDENDPAYRAAGLAGSAGVATARSLSRFYAALIGPVPVDPEDPEQPAGGRADPAGAAAGGAPQPAPRRRLFTPATLTQARSEESAGPDRVLVVGTRFGLGFMLHGPSAPMLGPQSFGHPGRGGSLAFADPEWGVSFAYVTNGMQRSVTSDPRAQALVRALRRCL